VHEVREEDITIEYFFFRIMAILRMRVIDEIAMKNIRQSACQKCRERRLHGKIFVVESYDLQPLHG
jgi:hypothetical protein